MSVFCLKLFLLCEIPEAFKEWNRDVRVTIYWNYLERSSETAQETRGLI